MYYTFEQFELGHHVVHSSLHKFCALKLVGLDIASCSLKATIAF